MRLIVLVKRKTGVQVQRNQLSQTIAESSYGAPALISVWKHGPRERMPLSRQRHYGPPVISPAVADIAASFLNSF